MKSAETIRSLSLSRWPTVAAFLFLLLVTTIHFREPLVGKGVFYRVDLGDTYLPMHVENARLRAAGEIPLWNSHGFLGYPTQAETEVSGVYPPGLIFNLVSDCGIAYTLFIIFHFLVAAMGMMYLMGVLGAGKLGQTCAAIVFVFGGTFLDYVVTLTILTTLAWTPLVLGLQLQSFKCGSMRYSVIAGIVVAVQASGANPTAGIHQVLLMFGATLMEASRPQGLSRLYFAIKSTLCTLFVGFCLSAPQMLYFFEYIVQSERWGGAQPNLTPNYGSLPPMLLLQAIVPNLWLPWTRLPIENEYRLYFGILSLSLMIIGSCTRKRFLPLFRVLFVVGILLALGEYGGIWSLCRHLPLFKDLHVPWRFLLLASLAASVLTGVGLDRLVQRTHVDHYKRSSIYSYLTLTTVLIVLALLVWSEQLRLDELAGIDRAVLLRCLLFASLFAGLSTASWCFFARIETQKTIGAFALCIITVDLLVCGSSIHTLAPPNYYSEVPPTVAALRKDTTQCRVFRVYVNMRKEIAFPEPGLFPQNMPALFEIDGYVANAAAPLLDVSPIWKMENGKPSLSLKEQGLFNIKYLILADPMVLHVPDNVTGKAKVAPHTFFDDLDCRMFRNPYWQPRISIRSQYKVVRDFDEVRAYINSSEFSLSESVTIDHDPVFVSGSPLTSSNPSEPIHLVHYGAHRVTLDVEVTQNSILVLSDFHYPGWHATSNGKQLKILRANGLVRGLALGTGHHQIEFTYRPSSFYWGFFPMVAMAIVLIAYFIKSILRKSVTKTTSARS